MNYYLWISGAEQGPYDIEQIRAAVADGTIDAQQTARTEDSADWKPLSQIARLHQSKQAAATTATHSQTSTKPAASHTPPQAPSVPSTSPTSPAVASLLALLVVLTAADLYFRYEERAQRQTEREQRQEIVRAVATASTEIDIKRIGVFTDYMKNLDAYETKSIYHQIYHANNAQLQLLNLSIQEQKLMIQLLAGKK